MKKIALAASALALVGVTYTIVTPAQSPNELRRVDCSKLTVFAPVRGQSPEQLCRGHGGLAKIGMAPNEEGMVILVRNQPVGGFEGKSTIR